MPRLRYLIASIVLLANNSFAVDEAQVNTLIGQYSNALQTGNVSSLNALTSGYLKAKRQRLWSNPNYPQYLIDSYRDATITVRSITEVNAYIILDVAINSYKVNVHKSLTLEYVQDTLKITDERIISNRSQRDVTN